MMSPDARGITGFYCMVKCCMVCQIRLRGTKTDSGKLDLFDLLSNSYI
jgi:hypothetical protein